MIEERTQARNIDSKYCLVGFDYGSLAAQRRVLQQNLPSTDMTPAPERQFNAMQRNEEGSLLGTLDAGAIDDFVPWERYPCCLQVNNKQNSATDWKAPSVYRFDRPLPIRRAFDPNPLWQLWQ